MAGTNNGFQSQPYLSPNQQDLLMAALNSNNIQNTQNVLPGGQSIPKDSNPYSQTYNIDGLDPTFFTSPQQNGLGDDFGGYRNLEESPFVDYLDGDTSFDYDNGTGDLMIGDIPGGSGSQSGSAEGNENGDKRKSMDDDEEDGGGKRREGDDKQAKKPGRKPLMSEPTTKRKAQNRAAQRAFRERKEKHLKDLETKVTELEKESNAANQENGLLRAQVQRLQTELKEYRKRMSANSSGISRSPSNPFANYLSMANGGNNNNFQFEFPRFGGLPGTQMFNNGAFGSKSASFPTPGPSGLSPSSTTSGVLSRNDSASRSLSPKTTNGSPENGIPSPAGSRHQSVGNVNSPPASAANGGSSTPHAVRSNTAESTGSQNRIFQFNSGSLSVNTGSPSASSVSQYGANSSCGTSPEPTYNSPQSKTDGGFEMIKDGYKCTGNSEGEVTFCEQLNMACGNPQNPIPRAMSRSDGNSANNGASTAKEPESNDIVADSSGLDLFASQNGGQFDPALFGDYRDPQAAIVGDGDFTNGFFDEAFDIGNYGSPFNFGTGLTPAVATANKVNPLELVEKLQDGVDDEVVPGDDMSQMLNCHKIWDKIAGRPDFKDGTIDIDNLCSELRAKARCSENGVVIDNKDVEAALKRLPEGSRT